MTKSNEDEFGEHMIALRLAHVCQTLSSWTGIPAERLMPTNTYDWKGLRDQLSAVVFGQEKAIQSAVAAIERRFALPERTGMRRPVWNVLCVGPSGVGKSALARQLAIHFFGEESALVAINCSQLDQEHHIARLVGSPPGYVGHGQGGELTNALRRRKDGLLLFDEIEKAHPVILSNVLLPLLGEGIVHDMNDGSPLDASNMIVVMTSNIGCDQTDEALAGFRVANDPTTTVKEENVLAAVAQRVPHEVLGRIDDVIVFNLLSDESVRHIWRRELESFGHRLAALGNAVTVHIDIAAENMLLSHVKSATDTQGARAVIRFFDRTVVNRGLALLRDGAPVGAVLRVEQTGEGIRFRLDAPETGDQENSTSGSVV